MLGRVITTGVVVFWVAMMAALIRTEYWPSAGPINQVPAELVLRKVFSREGARLNVYFQDQDIGSCLLDITPLTAPAADGVAGGATVPAAYHVHLNLKLVLAIFRQPTRLGVEGDAVLNPRYEIESFDVTSTVADGRVGVRGNPRSGQLLLETIYDGRRQQRLINLRELPATGFASLLGLPELAGAAGTVGGAGASLAASAAGRRPRTSAILTSVRVGGVSQRAYLVEVRQDDTFWAKIWINQQGEILLVENSLGITLLADVFTPGTIQTE